MLLEMVHKDCKISKFMDFVCEIEIVYQWCSTDSTTSIHSIEQNPEFWLQSQMVPLMPIQIFSIRKLE